MKTSVKKVRKILPLSLYDIPGIESWLEEQANAGLFPVSLDAWVTFKPTGVPGTRFRLEPWGKMGTEPSEEQLELYHQAGWEYAFAVGRVFFLFYTTDRNAVDLYSDHQSRGQSLERLEKRVQFHRRIRTAIWSMLGLLLVWSLFFYQSKYDVQPNPLAGLPLTLLRLSSPFVLLVMAVLFFCWRQGRRDRHILEKTCQALNAGLAPPSSRGPSPVLVREHVITLILIPILLIGWVLMLLSNLGLLSVPVQEFTRPYVVLQELEQVELVSSQEVLAPFHGGENQAEIHISLLAPAWYSVTQKGCDVAEGDYIGYSPDPDGGRFRYTPSLDATYFHLLFPALARPVAQSQMDQDRAVNLYWTYEELSYPGLDFVILASEPRGVYQGLALGKGGHVAVFHYGGVEQLTDHLELLATMVR